MYLSAISVLPVGRVMTFADLLDRWRCEGGLLRRVIPIIEGERMWGVFAGAAFAGLLALLFGRAELHTHRRHR